LLVDLHNHTRHSPDSRNRLRDYERAYAHGRVDVVAITDHNTIAGAMDFRERASFPVIVGEEIDTADGELIGLFLEAHVPVGLSAIETAERIRSQGGLVYLQHPFYRLIRGRVRPDAREHLRSRGLLDIVEAQNGGPFTAADNARALQWARACGLLHWLLAEELVEQHARGKGPRSLRGASCAEIVSKLFKLHRHALTDGIALLKVTTVQVRATHAWAVVDLGGARKYIAFARREGAAWKLGMMLGYDQMV